MSGLSEREILKAAAEIRKLKSAAKAARRAEREEMLTEKIVSLPDQRFGLILADPPWRFEVRSVNGMDRAADNHYPTQTTEDIMLLDIPGISAPDCILYLWATVPMLPDALRVMKAWEFKYKSHCVWMKNKLGTGYWFRNQHELLLVGTKGKVPAPLMGTQWSSVVQDNVTAHSKKPEQFYRMMEQYFPTVPKLEMYARSAREGWSVCGLEVE